MLASGGASGGAGFVLITFNFIDMICCLLFCCSSSLIWYGTYCVVGFYDVVSIKGNTKTQKVNLLIAFLEMWVVNAAGNSKLRYQRSYQLIVRQENKPRVLAPLSAIDRSPAMAV